MHGALIEADQLVGCPHRFVLETAACLSSRAFPPESISMQYREQATQRRTGEIYEQLAQEHGAVVVPTAHSDQAVDAAVAATVEACARKVPIICGATVPADVKAGRAAASGIMLLSPTGGSYTPVITVNHKCYDVRAPHAPRPPRLAADEAVRPSLIPHASPLYVWDPQPRVDFRLRHHTRDHLRLTHMGLLMRKAGIATSGQGGVVDVRGEWAVAHWLDECLPNYRKQFRRRRHLQVETRHAVEMRAPLPTVPQRRAECRACRWWESHCGPVLEQREDVSLVVSVQQAAALRKENVTTVPQLAHPDVVEPADWAGGSFETAVALARAQQLGFSVVRSREAEPFTRADVEIDIDMESALDDGAYLWGTLLTYPQEESAQRMAAAVKAAGNGAGSGGDGNRVTAADITPGYRPFVTWEPLPSVSTAYCFVEMWQWLSGIRALADAAGLSCGVYCYAQHGERQWMASNVHHHPEVPGMPTPAELRGLWESPQWVDMFSVMDRRFIGVRGLGLKKVAPVAGFQWRDSDPSGEASIVWHEQAVEKGDGGEGDREASRVRIMAYNEDDVRATCALREWLSHPDAVAKLPLRDDLVREDGV